MSATETQTPEQANGTEPETPKPHKSLAKALLAVQRDMPAIERDGSSHHGKYTTLGNLLAKAKPILTQHGMIVSQLPSHDGEGRPTLRTLLIHESGEKLESQALLAPSKNDPQGHGSALTYMRRYALAAALGISDQEDKDGNVGGRRSQTGPKLDPAKVAALKESFKKRKEGAGTFTFGDFDLLLGSIGVDSLRAHSTKAFEERLASLSDEQAEALAKELAE